MTHALLSASGNGSIYGPNKNSTVGAQTYRDRHHLHPGATSENSSLSRWSRRGHRSFHLSADELHLAAVLSEAGRAELFFRHQVGESLVEFIVMTDLNLGIVSI